jgi:hypothetical protein
MSHFAPPGHKKARIKKLALGNESSISYHLKNAGGRLRLICGQGLGKFRWLFFGYFL